MRSIRGFLKNRNIVAKNELDQESVFYIFKGLIRIKFGEVGVLNVIPDFYKKGVIFLKIANSNWANEIWLNKQMLIDEMNLKIGNKDIVDIKVKGLR
ncbi:MAG: hypothetical protein V3574_04495 [Candidatus Moraniibacteriota bacterium]